MSIAWTGEMNTHPQLQLYLASSSPRRKELLIQMGVCFSVVKQKVQEIRHAGETAEDFVTRLAQEKAMAGYKQCGSHQLPVLGADTIIVTDEQILGKPENRQHGISMLMSLSGRTHRVMTAVAVQDGQELETALNISQVTFAVLTPLICEHYWDTGEPIDKAGGYAIQGRGALFIKQLQGSYSGVMGLPIYETALVLKKFDIHVL